MKILECYDVVRDYEKILECLYRYKDKVDET